MQPFRSSSSKKKNEKNSKNEKEELQKADVNYLKKESEFRGANFSFWFGPPPIDFPLKRVAMPAAESKRVDAFLSDPYLDAAFFDGARQPPLVLPDPMDACGGRDPTLLLSRCHEDSATASSSSSSAAPDSTSSASSGLPGAEDSAIEAEFRERVHDLAPKPGAKRRRTWSEHASELSWLRAFRYLDTGGDVRSTVSDARVASAAADRLADGMLRQRDAVEVLDCINAGFLTPAQRAACQLEHPTNKALRCEEIAPLLPAAVLGGALPRELQQVQLDEPLPKTTGRKPHLVAMYDEFGHHFAALVEPEGRRREGEAAGGGEIYALRALYNVKEVPQQLTMPVMEHEGAIYYFMPEVFKYQFRLAKKTMGKQSSLPDAPLHYEINFEKQEG